MKKSILSMIFLLSISVAAMAQWNGGNGQRPRMDRTEMIKQRTEQMVKRYGLNEEQAAALQALNEKIMAQMGGQRGNGQRQERAEGDNRQEKKEGEARGENRGQRMRGQGGFGAGRQNNEAYEAELQKILTPEQYKQYTEDREKMRQQFGQRGGQRGQRQGGRGDRQRNNEE